MPDACSAVQLARLRELTISGEARKIRLSHHLSYPEVGAAIGVHHTTVMRWEQGGRRPRGEAALRYLALLDELNDLKAVGA